MRVPILRWIAGAAVALALPACAAPTKSDATDSTRATLQSLNGVYTSLAVEPWYGAYGTRRFEFREGRWSLVFDFALDPGMTQKVFRVRAYGPYHVLQRSAAEPRAFDAVFTEKAKFVTWHLNDPALLAKFGMAGCGLTTGVEKDISIQGCAAWPPVAVCGDDHDLLGVDREGQHYFGVRPPDNNMCTPDRRPTQLLPPVRRTG